MAARTDGGGARCERADALPVGARRSDAAAGGVGAGVEGEWARLGVVRFVKPRPCPQCGEPAEIGERLCHLCLRDAAREAASHYTKGIA